MDLTEKHEYIKKMRADALWARRALVAAMNARNLRLGEAKHEYRTYLVDKIKTTLERRPRTLDRETWRDQLILLVAETLADIYVQ